MSLKEMFGWLTAAAVFFWCVGQAGFDNGLFWLVTFVAALMSLMWWAAARSRGGARWLAPFAALPLGFFCGLPFGSLPLLVQAGLLFVAGIACAALAPLRPRTLAAAATGCLLAALASEALEIRQERQDLEALRRATQVASLEPRLAYEQQRRGQEPAAAAPVLSPDVEGTLHEMELPRRPYRNRQLGLEWLHTQASKNFAGSEGFGVTRMPRPSRSWVDRPELADIAFDEVSSPDEDRSYADWDVAFFPRDRVEKVEDLHVASRDDFLDPGGFGWIAEPLTKVAGFISHAFHAPATAALKDPQAWTVERLELVSLLKFDEPRVYVLDHLPRMDQLASNEAPTRELDAFEAAALARLRTDVDVIVEEGDDAVRMLGSLRAATQCLDCHSVQRGELLGAFSYVLAEGARHEERDEVGSPSGD